jgi:hypothetical protein
LAILENFELVIRLNEAVWMYDFSPIVDCQNLPAPGEFWGQSDLEDDVLEIVRAINFIASNTARIIRFHAHPKTWGRGFMAKDLRIGVDETIVLPGENAELHNLEMQSDLASSLRYLDMLRQALHEISRVPEVSRKSGTGRKFVRCCFAGSLSTAY